MGLAMAALTVVLLSSSVGQAILPYLTLPYLTLPQAYLVRKGGAMFLELQKLQHPWHLEHSTTHAHYGVCLAGGTK